MLSASSLANEQLEPPAFYLPALHYIGFVSTIVALFSLYVIVNHSTKTMAGMKWHLFNITLTLLVGDFYMEYLYTPVPLFPTIGGYSLGSLSPFISFHYLMMGGIAILYSGMASIICAFLHRHNCLALEEWQLSNRGLALAYALIYSVPLLALTTTFHFSRCDPDELRSFIEKTNPNLNLDKLYSLNFIWMDFSLNPMIAVFTGVALVVVLGSIVSIQLLISHSYAQLRAHAQGASMSEQTRAIQRSFMRILIIQSMIPMVTAGGPIIILLLSVLSNISRELSCIAICVLASHCLANNITLFFAVRPYRLQLHAWLIRASLFKKVAETRFSSHFRAPQSQTESSYRSSIYI